MVTFHRLFGQSSSHVACISILLIAGMGVACRTKSDNSPVIANLNAHEVHRDEFERFLELKMGEFDTAALSDSIRSQMLDDYIKRRLVLEEAARLGITVGSAEMEQTAQDNPQMKSTVATAATREELARDLLVEKYYRQIALKDVRVSPEEVQQYIEKNQSRLTDRPGFLVREIRVQSREEADKLRREVTEGRRDFASVAKLHSDAPNSSQSGLTHYTEGQLPDVLGKAVQQLRPGDVSPVIESNYGFHIFKLEQRTQPHAMEERRSQLDDRRAQLTEELIARKNQQAVDTALDRLTSAAIIKIDDSALGFTYTGTLRHN
ncbi:MAG TPA: peptidyl-prolyl cis-trans isomerase [Blastocatellia bacterium]|nr:peptidyl-prolyl cis-trans isomerase [Blastocatellia bacterium]